MLRSGTGDDGDRAELGKKRDTIHVAAIEVVAEEHVDHRYRAAVADGKDLCGDGASRVGVIAGDHHDAHSRPEARCDRIGNARTDWIVERDQTEPPQARLVARAVGRPGRSCRARGYAEHPHPLSRQLGSALERCGPLRLVERAQRHDALDSSFHGGDGSPIEQPDVRHATTHRIERVIPHQRRTPKSLGAGAVEVARMRSCEGEDGGIEWIARIGLARQDRHGEDPGTDHLRYDEAASRERAGLVRADHRARTQRLHGR